MNAHVLVPVKRLDRAKTRLADALSPGERAELMRTMLDRVLAAVRSAGVERITLVTSEPIDADGAVRWNDRGLPWNEALAAALRDVVSEPVAAVISADLPLLRPEEVVALIEATPEAGIVVARAVDGGTNAVSMRPPGAIATCFGEPLSARLHAEAAGARHLECVVLDLPGLAFDVDTPEDLERMREEAA